MEPAFTRYMPTCRGHCLLAWMLAYVDNMDLRQTLDYIYTMRYQDLTKYRIFSRHRYDTDSLLHSINVVREQYPTFPTDAALKQELGVLYIESTIFGFKHMDTVQYDLTQRPEWLWCRILKLAALAFIGQIGHTYRVTEVKPMTLEMRLSGSCTVPITPEFGANEVFTGPLVTHNKYFNFYPSHQAMYIALALERRKHDIAELNTYWGVYYDPHVCSWNLVNRSMYHGCSCVSDQRNFDGKSLLCTRRKYILKQLWRAGLWFNMRAEHQHRLPLDCLVGHHYGAARYAIEVMGESDIGVMAYIMGCVGDYERMLFKDRVKYRYRLVKFVRWFMTWRKVDAAHAIPLEMEVLDLSAASRRNYMAQLNYELLEGLLTGEKI